MRLLVIDGNSIANRRKKFPNQTVREFFVAAIYCPELEPNRASSTVEAA